MFILFICRVAQIHLIQPFTMVRASDSFTT